MCLRPTLREHALCALQDASHGDWVLLDETFEGLYHQLALRNCSRVNISDIQRTKNFVKFKLICSEIMYLYYFSCVLNPAIGYIY